MIEYGFPIKLNTLLCEISELTNNYKNKDGMGIKEILINACSKENFVKRYDCMFWSEDGFNWSYNKNHDVVKKVDDFFLEYRNEFFPNLPFLSYSPEKNIKTRTEYLHKI